MKKRKFALRILSAVLLISMMANLLGGCGNSRTARETEATTYGIDVARYQGTIDWQQVAQAGVQFAMVRLGYRSMTQGQIVEDSNARYNLQEAGKAGVRLGAYFFSTAVTEEEAVEEAQWVADLLDKYPITYPVAYDCEGFADPESRQYGLSKTQRTDIALAFLETIEDLGYLGMFYGCKHDLEWSEGWEMERLQDDYKIWVAQYPAQPYPETAQSTYVGEHQMWQFTKEGIVPGITQPVDINVAYFGYDGIEPPKDGIPPEEVGPDVEALMNFTQVQEDVTAKDETNLRSVPSQGEDSQVLYTLKNGEVAQRIAVSSNGWSKVIFNGETYYAVSSYLTTDLDYNPEDAAQDPDGDGIQTEFAEVDEQVTAKEVVNLRALPSVEHEDADVVGQLNNGDVAQRVGISENGWSKLIYNGTTCYAVSSYLTLVEGQATQPETQPGTQTDGTFEVQTQFEEVNEQVTAKEEVNLRNIPSVEHPDSKVVATIHNGDVVTRTGINRDVGWSRVEYNGQVLYCVSSYVTLAE